LKKIGGAGGVDVFSLPTVEQLKIKLGIEDPGRGNVHPGYASMGIHVDDYEAQHAGSMSMAR